MTEIFNSTLKPESFFQTTDFFSFLPELAMAYPDLLFEQIWLHILLILVFALFNGFFVAAEVAFIKLRAAQFDQLEGSDADSKTINQTRKIFDNLDRYIPACKFGSCLATVLLGAISVPFLSFQLKPLIEKFGFLIPQVEQTVSVFFALVIVIPILMIVGKVIPNSLGFRHEMAVSMKTARTLHIFFVCFSPLILLLTSFSNWFLESVLRVQPATERESEHSAEDIKIFVEESGADAVTPTEKEILINTLELNDLKVLDIMIPRKDVVTLDVNASFEEILETAYNSEYTRFPLVDGHLDETIGQIHVKELLRLSQENKTNLKANRRKIIWVDEEMELDHLLKIMLNNKARIALVGDEFGGAEGLVMFTDVLEILVGDIRDEFEGEAEPQLKEISEDEYVVAGSMPLHELDDEVPELDLESPGVSTVGGYVTALMGRLPKKGETSEVDGFEVTVTDADEKKVIEVKFNRIKSKEEEPTAKEEDLAKAESKPKSKPKAKSKATSKKQRAAS